MSINKARLLEEFLELVQVDSAPREEREIADVLKEKLLAIGFAVSEDDAGTKIAGNAGNLIATLPGDPNKPTLLFSAHMDRVTPGKGIRPQVVDGIIQSDGSTILAADDVSGLTAILEGVRVIKENGIPHGQIEVVFTVAEEGGLHGAKGLDPKTLHSDMGFFFDATGPVGTIVTNAPAQQNIGATFTGKAAHAGIAPEKGISAILVAAHALTKMKLGRIDEETTANIGIISGGTATNIVPDNVSIKGEVRSRNGEKLAHQVEHMRTVLEQAAREFGATVAIEVKESYAEFRLSENDEVVQLALKALKAIDREATLEGTGGGSDANIVNGYGIPSVVIGMGYNNVHSTNETIEVAELEAAAELVAALIENC